MHRLAVKLSAISSLVLLLILPLGHVYANAGEMPPGWPWRGVTSDVDALAKDPEIINFLANEGVSFVRLHINVFSLMSDYSLDAEEALDYALSVSRKAAKRLADKKIRSIISVANFPVDGHQCRYKAKESYWRLNGECVRQIYNFVDRTTDAMLKSDIVGYEFLAEPVVKKSNLLFKRYEQPENWIDIFQNILQKVREKDIKRYVVFSLGPWAFPDNYKTFEPFSDKKIIYDLHMYQPLLYAFQGIKGNEDGVRYPGVVQVRKTFPSYDRFPNVYWNENTLDEILRPAMEFQEKYDVPVFVGEFGAVLWAQNSNKYLSDLLNIFQRNNWGWAYFNIGSRWHGFDARFEPYKENGKYRFNYIGHSTKRMEMLREYFKKQ